MAFTKLENHSGLQRTRELRANLEVVQSIEPPKCSPAVGASSQDLSTAPFFGFSNDKAVRILGQAFKPEFERLKHAEPTVETGPEKPNGNLGPNNDLTPSKYLYDEDFPEVNRTVVAVLTLKWLLSNNYSTFTAHQNPSTKLSQDSFRKLRELFLASFQSGEEVYALIVALVINDLGKDKKLWDQVQGEMEAGKPQPNHDEILYLATEFKMIPLISDFPESSPCHTSLLRGLRLGSSLNLAQLVQAENVPASLLAIQSLGSDRHALTLKFFEILLDVAGAQGHIEPRSCTTLTEPLNRAYYDIRKAMFDLLEGNISPRQAYDEVLKQKAEMLSQSSFQKLSVEERNERALLRLLCMARVSSAKEAQILEAAFKSLKPQVRTSLVDGLSVDGIDDGDAIIPYYAPSLFAVLFRKLSTIPRKRFTEAMAAILRFLIKVYDGTKPIQGSLGRVIECDLHFSQATLKSDEFVENPSILDRIEIPRSVYGRAVDSDSIAKGVS